MAMSNKTHNNPQPPPKPPDVPVAEEVDVIASLPKAPSKDNVSMQVVIPNWRDAPAHLKKRFLEFEAPMGHGPALRSPTDPAYVKECREFLVTHEWEEVYSGMWRDPQTAGGHRGEKRVVRMLPNNKTGVDEPLQQLVLPPAERLWSTEEAVGTVRVRLAREESAACPSLIERLDAANAVIADLRKHDAGVLNDLAQLRRRPIPDNKETLKAELHYVRRVALAAAEALKAGPAGKEEAA